MFSELFYQHRAAGFSEGREQHDTCHISQLPLVHTSVSVPARQLGIQPRLLISSFGPLDFWLQPAATAPQVCWGQVMAKAGSKWQLLLRSISQ